MDLTTVGEQRDTGESSPKSDESLILGLWNSILYRKKDRGDWRRELEERQPVIYEVGVINAKTRICVVCVREGSRKCKRRGNQIFVCSKRGRKRSPETSLQWNRLRVRDQLDRF